MVKKEISHRDSKIAWLFQEGQKILSDPERVFELVGKRLALRVVELEKYFATNTFRLGIVGNPNRGKTTYAYSCFSLLQNYRFPTQFVDMDIYSYSGNAIAGKIRWEDRPKRSDAPKKDVTESINVLRKAGPGIVIADFPGRPDNEYQPDRLKEFDLVMLLGNNRKDRKRWDAQVTKANVSSLWLRTQADKKLQYPIDPTIYDLNREPKPYGLDVMTSLTRVMEVIGRMVGIPVPNPWGLFSEPERLILEEMLDFKYAPLAHGAEYE